MKRVFVLGGVVAALATATPASAQVTLGWDVAGFSSYVWRGVTLSGKPVIQPDVYLTIPVGKASITAGGWGSIEVGKYDGGDISEGGGTGSFNLTEFDWWGEIGIPAGVATLTAGATGYIYPNDAGAHQRFQHHRALREDCAGGPAQPEGLGLLRRRQGQGTLR